MPRKKTAAEEVKKESVEELKTEEAKAEDVNAEEPVIEKAKKRVRKIVKDAEAAAEPVKKGGRRAAKAIEEKAEEVKTAVTKKVPKKKKAPAMIVQSQMGGEAALDDLLAKIKGIAGDVETVYIKPEENKAYYVKNGETGSVEIW